MCLFLWRGLLDYNVCFYITRAVLLCVQENALNSTYFAHELLESDSGLSVDLKFLFIITINIATYSNGFEINGKNNKAVFLN